MVERHAAVVVQLAAQRQRHDGVVGVEEDRLYEVGLCGLDPDLEAAVRAGGHADRLARHLVDHADQGLGLGSTHLPHDAGEPGVRGDRGAVVRSAERQARGVERRVEVGIVRVIGMAGRDVLPGRVADEVAAPAGDERRGGHGPGEGGRTRELGDRVEADEQGRVQGERVGGGPVEGLVRRDRQVETAGGDVDPCGHGAVRPAQDGGSGHAVGCVERLRQRELERRHGADTGRAVHRGRRDDARPVDRQRESDVDFGDTRQVEGSPCVQPLRRHGGACSAGAGRRDEQAHACRVGGDTPRLVARPHVGTGEGPGGVGDADTKEPIGHQRPDEHVAAGSRGTRETRGGLEIGERALAVACVAAHGLQRLASAE